MSRSLASALVCLMVLLVAGGRGWAQQTDRASRAADIERANRALDAGEFDQARSIVRVVISAGPALTRLERGEAFRILALSNFFQDKTEMARAAFLEFLRSDPDAHLDPALVPPEVIALLEDVRARHSAELDSYRKKPKQKRYLLLNLVPAAGQFQNGERSKGVLLGAGMGLMLSANLASYFVLRSMCDDVDRTCSSSSGKDRTSLARSLQTVNILAGVGLLSLYTYSVIDGYLGYRRATKRQQQHADYMSVMLIPEQGGASLALSLGF